MPGPPTPVSACILKRLEVRDGTSVRIYAPNGPYNTLSFTLEGERLLGSETGMLILLIHNGQQQIVSVRSVDLLKSCTSTSDIVAIDRFSQQLCVKVPRQNCVIIAQFEEKRDFSVAVCMLKTQFNVGESIPRIASSLTTSHPSTPAQGIDVASNYGPRLSSFTPMRRPSLPAGVNSDNLTHAGFTTLNSVHPHSEPNSVTARGHFAHPTQGSRSPGLQSLPNLVGAPNTSITYVDNSALDQQFNPYNIFLGRRNELSKPKVGSPLRNSVQVGGLFRSWSGPLETSDATTASPSRTLPPQTMSHSQPGITSYSMENNSLHGDGLASHLPTDPLLGTPHKHPNRQTAVQSPSQCESARTTQELHDSMPKRRKLPFDTSPKMPKKPKQTPMGRRSATSLISSSQVSSLSTPASLRIPGNQSKYTDRGTSCRIVCLGRKSITPKAQTVVEVDSGHSAAIDSQAPSAVSIPHTAGASTGSLDSLASPSNLACLPEPAILLASHEVLGELSRATSKLLDQHQEDVANGNDEVSSAKFYIGQIETMRKDFWYERLLSACHGGLPVAV